MAQGIMASVIVTMLWISLHLLLIHVKPVKNRFMAMICGYLVSLPFIVPAYFLLPVEIVLRLEVSPTPGGMGLFHAFLLHLLLFFLYAECFYHIERSVTLRVLVELNAAPARSEEIQYRYPLDEMIEKRLEILQGEGFIERRKENWYNTGKGNLFAKVMIASTWIFQSKSQKDRM